MSDDNVIQFPLELVRGMLESRLEWQDIASASCKHARLSVDRSLRTVTCQDCSGSVDAVEVLYGIAWSRRHAEDWAAAWRREEKETRERLDDLKKEAAKYRAQIRDAKRADVVERFKAETLEKIAERADRLIATTEESERERIRKEAEGIIGGLFGGDVSKIQYRDPKPGELEAELVSQLHGIMHCAGALMNGEAYERFSHKIWAGIQEIEARRRRKSIRIVTKAKGKRA